MDFAHVNAKPGNCGKCSGTGEYLRFGTCWSCQGTGRQTRRQMRRNLAFNGYQIGRAF